MLLIPDRRGRPVEYSVGREGGELLLTRADGRGGPYRVGRRRGGAWTCTCPGYRWRGRCKHCREVAARGGDLPMTPQELRKALAAPFAASRIGWKPQAIHGGRALAVAYVDARDVEDRLDAAVGIDRWQDDYQDGPDGTVTCRLSIRFERVEPDGSRSAEWVTKSDVGGASEQPDAGDRRKAAYSDALKRAAVKWGIGRYLYNLPAQWCDYDPQKKQFARTPQLPEWALPRKEERP